MIKIYGIKNCDSVKKAIQYCKKNDLEYTLQDFKQDPVNEKKIATWLQKTDINTLFNAKSTTYRNLKLKEHNLNDMQKQEWLVKENLLIKRPVIEYDSTLVVGFNEEQYKGVFS